jgi:CRP/FNR family transcriptional regulator
MIPINELSAQARCSTCAVRHKAVCGALNEDELARLNRIARTRHIRAGQTIFSDSEHPGFFANVISGVIKLTKTMSDGRQQIVGLQFAPDFLGRTFGHASPHIAEAATDVELCCFSSGAFEVILKEHPSLEHRLFENTLDELDAAREWMLLLGRKTAREKVASFLLMIAQRAPNIGCAHSGELGFVQFQLPLSRADIADFTGLTIETVSRHFTRLKSSGVIQIANNRDIIVPDVAALEALADEDASAAAR